LISGKTYLFFSHTAKKQPYNRSLLQEMLKKRIRMIDYEYLTETNGNRVVAFGRWAGIVGAYKALRARGLRTDNFKLKPAHECHDMDELFAGLKKVKLKPIKILVTGEGRVAGGALETLSNLNIRKVSPEEFLKQTFDEPVICQVGPQDYVEHKEGKPFDFGHFMKHPEEYTSTFLPFTKVTDIFIACHFWDPASPKFMTIEDMQAPDFKMSVIADVSCDIDGPIPSTIRASTIADPFYGFDPVTGKEVKPFSNKKHITVMAVDNLPGELPRNASSDFGNALIDKVYPFLFGTDSGGMIERATITRHGKLTERFGYLKDFVEGRDGS